MVYHVIGLMSGSSLDGLDIVFADLTEISGRWSFEIKASDCVAYEPALANQLRDAATLAVPDFVKLHTSFGRFMAAEVLRFIEKNELEHKVHFIASHGHTVWHEPKANTSTQIGDGATIAALTRLPVVSDLRNVDVALGGQGAPIVPVADKLLFPDYDFCLNIGGIANITVNDDQQMAFDICAANQLLNHFALKVGHHYDDQGKGAASGTVNRAVVEKLEGVDYFKQPAPKSLHNGFVHEAILPEFAGIEHNNDALATAVQHIVQCICHSLEPYHNGGSTKQLLVTGGGALNTFLVERLAEELDKMHIDVVVPEHSVIQYKEALAMALMGALRWREEENVQAGVTGASRNSVGGALWLS